jgi:hypothetical protein
MSIIIIIYVEGVEIMEKDKKVIDLKNRINKNVSLEISKSTIQHLTTDYGTIKNGKRHIMYANKYFGFTLKVPGEWCVFGYNEMKALAERNMRNFIFDDDMKRQMLEQISQNLNLFRACPTPERLPNAEDNPTFTCTASRIVMNYNVKAKDFIQDVKQQILSGNHGIKYTIIKDIKPTILGGVRFDMMEVCGTYFGTELYSRYFSTIRKGYELIYIASCMSEEGLRVLDKIIKSVKFDA